MAKVFTIAEGLENIGAMKTGGQGSVYKGRRIGEMISAIKILPTPIHSESSEDKNFSDFQNEVQKLKRVNAEPNANVVKILSSGITESGSLPYIEMEFIEGPDLEELLKEPHDPIFTIKEVLKVAAHISCALSHCHKLDVKHGDMKSNNVKFNTHTGNYVLLDFGLAIMSDEERRSSLRHAGAIEFMAPEQYDGHLLFESDIYGFGIIMFELLAGAVPFPLKDRGETARMAVMAAHMDLPLPGVYELRNNALPARWTDEQKKAEMEIPHWLISLINKCLRKKPADRYRNGAELHAHIMMHSLGNASPKPGDEQFVALQQENEKLLLENERLQQMLKESNSEKQRKPDKSAPLALGMEGPAATGKYSARRKTFLKIGVPLLILAIISLVTYFLVNDNYPKIEDEKPFVSLSDKPSLGEYVLLQKGIILYQQPKAAGTTRRLTIAENKKVNYFDEDNDFVLIQVNEGGIKTAGWVHKYQIASMANFAMLATARQYLSQGKTAEALSIFQQLSLAQIPEAMYQTGRLAMSNVNRQIDCREAYDLMLKAANLYYPPARRTMGMLHAFADNAGILQSYNLEQRCSVNKDLYRGSKWLMQAALQGDTASLRLLDLLNTQ